MFDKLKKINKTYSESFELTTAGIDEISKKVSEYTISEGIEKKRAGRCGFLIDDVLYRWYSNGEEGKKVTVVFGHKFFSPYVAIEMEGEKHDPYLKKDNADFVTDENTYMVNAGVCPSYQYNSGVNIITLKIKEDKNMVKSILILLAAAIVFGILGLKFIPEDIRLSIIDNISKPILDTFFDLLKCVAEPTIFFSVAWGICGIGDAHIFGRIGKKVMVYCLAITFIGSAVAVVFIPFLGCVISDGSLSGGEWASLFKMVLSIVPANIVDPFSTGNTLQIIFLAIAVGAALIALSGRVKGLSMALRQVNSVIHYLMSIVSNVVPVMVFLLVLNMIWNNTFDALSSTWKLILVVIGAFVLITFMIVVYISVALKVKMTTIIKKNLETFVVAITTASSTASFGVNLKASIYNYGMDGSFAGFAIPLGMIAHNPIAACHDMLLVLFFAGVYGVNISLGWVVMGVLVSAVIAISTPPIHGGAAISYALLLSQMGLPEEALAAVLIVDIFTDFLVTAFKCYLLPITLTKKAYDLDMIDMDVFRNENINK